MKIAMVNTLYPPFVKGGAERSTELLVRALAGRGHLVEVITANPGGLPALEANDSVRIHRVAPAGPYFPFDGMNRGPGRKLLYHVRDNFSAGHYRLFKGLLASIKPDVVHTNILTALTPAVWIAARRLKIPVVHNLRDYWLLCCRSGYFRAGNPCSRRCGDCKVLTYPRQRLTRFVDGAVAVGEYVLETHLSQGLFPNSVANEAILSIAENATSVAAPGRRASGESRLRVGYIGRLKATKGVHDLLSAVRRLPKDVPVEVRIAGAGEPEYVGSLKLLADERTTFEGWVRPDQFYPQLDAVVVPSVYPEPLPRTVLEAYSHGLPVIAARSGGISEVVVPGKTGWLYEPGDDETLARLLLRAVSGELPADTRAMGAVTSATQPDFVAARYEHLYERVIHGYRRG